VTLKALGRRVHAMTVGGRLKESLPIAQELLPRFERVFGRDSAETLVQLADSARSRTTSIRSMRRSSRRARSSPAPSAC
jgi:hypothetical protein